MSEIGIIRSAWLSPGGAETLNSEGPPVGGQGAFGYSVNVAGMGGMQFTLTWSSPPVPNLGICPGDVLIDLDVFFYSPFPGGGGTWDSIVPQCGPSPETGQVPAGATKALVMISYTTPWATNVGFKFEVLE